MTPEKALQIVQSMRPKPPNRRVMQAEPSVYVDYRTATSWKWDTATPHQKACFVRENRRLGIMDWDLCELFNLTQDGLTAIVKGKDWHLSFERLS